jgi:lipopolysaccharide biosynthesis glycosyltransferase
MPRKGGDVLGGAPSDPLVLVVGSDDRYAMPLAVTLHSALTRIPREVSVRVNVFDGGISQRNRLRVERVVRDARPATELDWHVLDHKRLEGLRVVRWMTTAAYMRLLIPEILEKEETVIYLDSDLLVQHDLSALLREADRFPGSAILAVDDFRHPDLGEVLGDQNCLDLGVDPRAAYFNSGVLVINVKEWRDLQVAEKAFAFVRQNAPIMRYHDQDALNVVLAGRWKRLDPRWNVMLLKLHDYIARDRGDELERQNRQRDMANGAFIFHFIGPHKPWAAGYQGLAKDQYLEAVRNAGWFEHDREAMLWRAKLAISSVRWRMYRRLPEGIRAKVRSMSHPP